MKARLHVVTGKGGVGKTVIALALCQALKAQNKKVLYLNIQDLPADNVLKELGISIWELNTIDSAKLYIAKKLGSQTIAEWIMRTPFFKSLFHMLPSLGHLIILGHIIERLEKDPELHLIFDSPSSGHVLGLFESTSNYKSMFKSGLIVEDINRMERFLANESNVLIHIISLPTQMALQEGVELKQELSSRIKAPLEVTFNDCYSLCPELQGLNEGLPPILQQKIALEKEILKDRTEQKIPHFTSLDLIETATLIAQEIRGRYE